MSLFEDLGGLLGRSLEGPLCFRSDRFSDTGLPKRLRLQLPSAVTLCSSHHVTAPRPRGGDESTRERAPQLPARACVHVKTVGRQAPWPPRGRPAALYFLIAGSQLWLTGSNSLCDVQIQGHDVVPQSEVQPWSWGGPVPSGGSARHLRGGGSSVSLCLCAVECVCSCALAPRAGLGSAQLPTDSPGRGAGAAGPV